MREYRLFLVRLYPIIYTSRPGERLLGGFPKHADYDSLTYAVLRSVRRVE